MDHRCGTRQTVPGEIVLCRRFSDPVRGRVRNISISGLFVELELDASEFALQSLVEVELTPPGGAGGRSCRCLAVVARTTPDGLGLMFDRVKPPAVVRFLAASDAALARPAIQPKLRAVRSVSSASVSEESPRSLLRA
jgi:hypothetical protein